MFHQSFSGEPRGAAGGSVDTGSTSIICPTSGSNSSTATTTTTISNSCSTSSTRVGNGKRSNDENFKEDKQDDSKKAKPSWSFSGITEEVLRAKESEDTSNGGVTDGKESNN